MRAMRRLIQLLLIALSVLAFAQSPSQNDSRPNVEWEKTVPPIYPPTAMNMGVSGLVRLQVDLDPNGNVQNAEVITGDPLLSDAAVAAVKQWKAKPTLANGSPVPSSVEVPVNFRLKPPTQQLMLSQDAVLMPSEPKVLSAVPPEYPAQARIARLQGTVVIRILVGTDGKVKAVKLISGHPMLAPAAIHAIKMWKYGPLEINNQARQFEADVKISFALQ